MISDPEKNDKLAVIRAFQNVEDIDAFHLAMISKLELIEKSQREAANNAHSKSAAKRHDELAEGTAVAIEFVNDLKAAYVANKRR